MAAEKAEFTFLAADAAAAHAFLSDAEVAQSFKKWNLDVSAKHLSFRFEQFFDGAQGKHDDAFLMALFTSGAFKEQFRTFDKNAWTPLETAVTGVHFERVPASVTNMGFFDRVSANADIARCVFCFCFFSFCC
jgi:hypothetical protein